MFLWCYIIKPKGDKIMYQNKSKFQKVKFILVCVVMVLSVFFAFLPRTRIDTYALSDEKKKTIEDSIFTLALAEERYISEFSYSVEYVYYSNEEWAGYVVDFTADNEKGFAIFFDCDGRLEVIEFSFRHSSPFYGRSGQYIYPALGYYYVKIGNNYYDAENSSLIENYSPSKEKIFYASGKNKNEGEVVTYSINYDTMRTTVYNLSTSFWAGFIYDDALESTIGKKNLCAPVAGVLLLNYWNKKFNNELLKVNQSGLAYGGNFTYDTCVEYCKIFYDYMDTNLLFWTGTTPGNCYRGFEKLIKKQNGFTSVRQTDLTFDDMISAVENDTPFFIVSKDYYFTQSSTLPTLRTPSTPQTLSITYDHFSGVSNAHTFIGIGILSYDYHLNDVLGWRDFIKICDGWGQIRYFSLDHGSIMSSAVIKVSRI